MAFIAESSRMVTVTRSGLGEAESARGKTSDEYNQLDKLLMSASGRLAPVKSLSPDRPLPNVKPTTDKKSRQPESNRQLCAHEQPARRGKN